MINLVFVNTDMKIGGIEKALLSMIHSLNPQEYRIHVLLFKEEGGFMPLLSDAASFPTSLYPHNVEIHHIRPEKLKESYIRGGVFSLLRGLLYRFRLRSIHNYKKSNNFQKSIMLTTKLCRLPSDVPCDVLISFSQMYYPFFWVSMQKGIVPKVLFIHQSWYDEDYIKLLHAYIHRYQKVICVSEAAKQYIDSKFPQCASNTLVVHNLLCPEQIKSLSVQPVDKELSHFSLLTIARLRVEKGCQFIPMILRRILDTGIKVYWYIIGGGPLYQELKTALEKMGLQQYLIMLGEKENPYPYLRMSDVYVQPSIHEGYGIAVQEAKILCKPIVATDIPAFKELIDSGVNGTLAELKLQTVTNQQFFETSDNCHVCNTDDQDVNINGFVDAIIDLILDQKKRDRYSEWLRNHPIDTDQYELSKLDEVFHQLCGHG